MSEPDDYREQDPFDLLGRRHRPADAPLLTRRVIGAGALGGLAGVVCVAVALGLPGSQYGAALFLVAPFLMGFTASVALNLDRLRSPEATFAAGLCSMGFVAVGLLVVAAEGLICLLMAAVPAIPAIGLGAWLGYVTCKIGRDPRRGLAVMLLLFPALPRLEALSASPPLREVTTVVEVAAPPEIVWDSVLGFDGLEPPSEWIFRAGIAYPIGARLEGSGVGAVRHCEFDTGAFVEPITAWEPGRRLAFDVAEQPLPMTELSPYDRVWAPHLLHGLTSEHGEFLLERLDGGRTRLVGTTWYRLDMAPQLYWGTLSDAIIHRIHVRVLRHVRDRAERANE